MLRRVGRWIGWAALVVVVDLIARAFAYALAAPTNSLHARLAGTLGGPKLVVLSLATAAAAITASAIVLALAEMGVRERWGLADAATRGPRPRIRLRAVATRAVGVWVTGLVLFALVESYIHWRAGLGFHGISCLAGPVHRNVIPIIGALALIGSAVAAALGHFVAWARRVVGRLFGQRAVAQRPRVAGERKPVLRVPTAPVLAALRARPPPVSSATR
jgi:hypothetical protein